MERTELKFCKKMLGLPFTATNNAVYGEAGRLPLWIRTQHRVVKFWNRLLNGRDGGTGPADPATAGPMFWYLINNQAALAY